MLHLTRSCWSRRWFSTTSAATRTKVFVDGNYVYSCLDKLVQKSEKPDDMWLDFDGFTTRLEKLLSDHSSDSKNLEVSQVYSYSSLKRSNLPIKTDIVKAMREEKIQTRNLEVSDAFPICFSAVALTTDFMFHACGPHEPHRVACALLAGSPLFIPALRRAAQRNSEVFALVCRNDWESRCAPLLGQSSEKIVPVFIDSLLESLVLPEAEFQQKGIGLRELAVKTHKLLAAHGGDTPSSMSSVGALLQEAGVLHHMRRLNVSISSLVSSAPDLFDVVRGPRFYGVVAKPSVTSPTADDEPRAEAARGDRASTLDEESDHQGWSRTYKDEGESDMEQGDLLTKAIREMTEFQSRGKEGPSAAQVEEAVGDPHDLEQLETGKTTSESLKELAGLGFRAGVLPDAKVKKSNLVLLLTTAGIPFKTKASLNELKDIALNNVAAVQLAIA